MRSALVLAASLALACASPPSPPSPPAERPLPEYARPTGAMTSGPARGDLIPYRALERSDFRAEEPPPQVAALERLPAAVTCGLVRASADSKIAVQPDGDGFTGWIPELRFVARMDRACSWWNPEQKLRLDYVLQHEQIHFAIYELSARRLNADAARIAARVRGRGATPVAAAADVEARLDDELRRALADVLARSEAFDRDTSLGEHREPQAAWARRIEAELAATAP